MGMKTVPHPAYSPDLAPCDFWLFPKLRGCRYETIEEMKEDVTKVIDTLTQEDSHEAFQKLLEQYNKCNATGGDYFEGHKSFMCVLSIKVSIRKTSGNLSYEPRVYIYIYIYIYIYLGKLITESCAYGRTNYFSSYTIQTITPEKRLKTGCLNWEKIWQAKKKITSLAHRKWGKPFFFFFFFFFQFLRYDCLKSTGRMGPNILLFLK